VSPPSTNTIGGLPPMGTALIPERQDRGYPVSGRGGGRGGRTDGREGGPHRATGNSSLDRATAANGDWNFHSHKKGVPRNAPPLAPVLQGRSGNSDFAVQPSDSGTTRQVKLTVEFPTQSQANKPNNVSVYFKRFATVLLATHPSVSILNWENPLQNPITKAIDISPHESTVKQYFSGMHVQANRRRIKGFVKLQCDVPFCELKKEGRFWAWMTQNKVFVRTTTLSQSRHVNLGWLLYSHPEYSNQDSARADLIHRMGNANGDFELVPHSISHTTSSGIKISTKALKLRANYSAHTEVFTNMLQCLAKGPSDSRLVLKSNTANFKLIPFANKTFSTDQTTALIQKQNDFLHNTKAISIVNLGSLEGIFTDKDKRAQDGGNKKGTRRILHPTMGWR